MSRSYVCPCCGDVYDEDSVEVEEIPESGDGYYGWSPAYEEYFCPNCGEEVTLDKELELHYCSYCGNDIIEKDEDGYYYSPEREYCNECAKKLELGLI